MDSGFVPPSTIQSRTNLLPLETNIRDFNMHPQDPYNPAFYPSTTTYAPIIGGAQPSLDKLHIPQTWQSGYPNSGFYSLPPTPTRATFSDTYQISPSSASPNFIPHDSVLRQGPRQRTAHACEKCRQRKTKCSGERPMCYRCSARGLTCVYASREGRGRGPSKHYFRPSASAAELRYSSLDSPSMPQGQKAVASSSPISPQSSPIRSTVPLPNTSPFASEVLWRDASPAPRDVRRVQSLVLPRGDSRALSTSLTPAASHELTPRTGYTGHQSFERMRSQSGHLSVRHPYLELNLDHADYLSDNSIGSEPPSATESHFSFSSASDLSSHASSSQCGASAPFHPDSHVPSPISMSESSASSPDSGLPETLTKEEYELFYENFLMAINSLPPEPSPQPGSVALGMEGCEQPTVPEQHPFPGEEREGHENNEGSQTISPPTPGLLSEFVVPDILREGMDPQYEGFKFYD